MDSSVGIGKSTFWGIGENCPGFGVQSSHILFLKIFQPIVFVGSED